VLSVISCRSSFADRNLIPVLLSEHRTDLRFL
jgi:hypothetical protein